MFTRKPRRRYWTLMIRKKKIEKIVLENIREDTKETFEEEVFLETHLEH